MVEFSPATRETRVRFSAVAIFCKKSFASIASFPSFYLFFSLVVVVRSREVGVSDLCFEKGVSARAGDLLEIDAVVVVSGESGPRAHRYYSIRTGMQIGEPPAVPLLAVPIWPCQCS